MALSMRLKPVPREPASGLNSRISMFGMKARPSTSASRPMVWKSSSRMRTRTPRSAAARSPRTSRPVLASAWMA
ncbi:hypothetical protein D9M72_316250 [compost metagenome]